MTQNALKLPVVPHFIGGSPATAAGRTLPVTNPATGEVIREVAAASREDVSAAVAAAFAAFPGWRSTTARMRAR